jgi:hypothetical protein
MTSVLVLAAAWILVGIPAVVAIFRERRSPDLHFARAMDALGHQPTKSNLRLGVSLTKRRAQVTSGIYASALVAVSVGLALDSPGVLAASVMLANLGTFYRISILRVRAVAAQRHAPPAYVLPPAPIEPPMVAILGPVTEVVERDTDTRSDERVVLIGS